MRSSERPFGGRFTEWTDGTYGVLSPRGERAVDTAPLPRKAPTAITQPLPGPPERPSAATATTAQLLQSPALVAAAISAAAEPSLLPGLPIPAITAATDPSARPAAVAGEANATTQVGVPSLAAAQVAPATMATEAGVTPVGPAPALPSSSSLSGSTPEDMSPPPSSRRGEASARPQKRPVVIKDDPVFDRLLDKLSYERPHVPEQKQESDGALAAAHSAGPRFLAPGVETPAREPRVKVSESLQREIAPLQKPRVAPVPSPPSGLAPREEGGFSPREIPTVTRSIPSDKTAEAPPGVPRNVRPAAIAALVLSLVFAAIVLGLFAVRPKKPDASEAAAGGSSVPGTTAAPPQVSDVSIPAPPPVDSLQSSPVEAPKALEAPARSEAVRSPRPRAGELTASPVTREPSPTATVPAPPSASVAPDPFHEHTSLEQKN